MLACRQPSDSKQALPYQHKQLSLTVASSVAVARCGMLRVACTWLLEAKSLSPPQIQVVDILSPFHRLHLHEVSNAAYSLHVLPVACAVTKCCVVDCEGKRCSVQYTRGSLHYRNICRCGDVPAQLRCVQCQAFHQRAATRYTAVCHRSRTSVVHAVGRSPSSIAEAFFNSSTSSRRQPLRQGQQIGGNGYDGPDAVVSFLSDDIVAAAFEHARQLRYGLNSCCIFRQLSRLPGPTRTAACHRRMMQQPPLHLACCAMACDVLLLLL